MIYRTTTSEGRHMTLWLRLGLTAFVLGAALEAGAQLGRIEIPAQNLFSFEEGTVEAWVLYEVEPTESNGSLFVFTVPKTARDLGAGMSMTFYVKDEGKHGKTNMVCGLRVGFWVDGREVPHPVMLNCNHFGKGQWHHVAAAWKEGKYFWAYLDGKEVARSDFPQSMVRDIPANAQIILGNNLLWYLARNPVVIDEVRVSSIARRAEDLGFQHSPPVPDIHTLFLETFEKTDGGMARPDVIASADIPSEFKIQGGGRIISGKNGKGFAFSPEEKERNNTKGKEKEK